MNTPAPWHLKGRGFILMYRFPEAFIRDSCFLPEEWKILKWTGIGFVMLVDYTDSPVGPYHELLIMPGKARIDKRKSRTVSRIYVDTFESMYDGRSNWGLPKEVTDFKWTQKDRRHLIQAGSFGSWFEMRLEVGSIPFPIHSRMLPLRLHQELDGMKYSVTPVASGTGRFCLVKDVKVDPYYFPELNMLEPLAAIYVDPFRMTFPAARIEKTAGSY